MILAYFLLCSAALVYWGARTIRLGRAGLFDRRGWLIPVGVVVLFVGLLSEETAILIGVGGALALIGEFFPQLRRRRAPATLAPPLLPKFERFRPALEPSKPDIELYLDAEGARVRNVGSVPLRLEGWSPGGANGWLKVRADDEAGAPLDALAPQSFARLAPWPGAPAGVRVWYTRADAPEVRRVFRAYWSAPPPGERELN